MYRIQITGEGGLMKNHYRALSPRAQDLTESPGSELGLRLLARAGAGTSGLWRPGYQAGGGPGLETVIP